MRVIKRVTVVGGSVIVDVIVYVMVVGYVRVDTVVAVSLEEYPTIPPSKKRYYS